MDRYDVGVIGVVWDLPFRTVLLGWEDVPAPLVAAPPECDLWTCGRGRGVVTPDMISLVISSSDVPLLWLRRGGDGKAGGKALKLIVVAECDLW
jgi:hypothetical protein